MPRKKVQVVDETRNIALALKELCEDKGLPTSVVVEAMSEALKKAYFKYSDDYPDTVIKVDMDLDTGSIKMYKIKNAIVLSNYNISVDNNITYYPIYMTMFINERNVGIPKLGKIDFSILE